MKPEPEAVRDRRLRRGRWTLIAIFAVVAALGAAAATGIEVRFDPRALTPDTEDGQQGERLVVLVRADDVLSDEPLRWMHELARDLRGRRWAAGVEAVTTTPIPMPAREQASPTLEELERGDAPMGPSPAVEDAVSRLVATAPERFPAGLASLPDTAHFEVVPPARGDRVRPQDAESLRRVLSHLSHPLVRGDRSAALVVATLHADADEAGSHRAVEDVRARLADGPPPGGVRASLTGLPAIRAQMEETLRADQWLLTGLAASASVLLLWLAFRSRRDVVVPAAAVGIALAIAIGGLAIAGEPLDLLLHVLPALLLTIAMGDAVHVVARHREEMRRGGPPAAAASRTLRAMASACFVTSLTTAVGFASLAVTNAPALRRFGVIAALGVLVTYVVVILFVPAALAVAKPAPDQPARRRGAIGALAGRLAAASVRRAPLAVGVAAVLLAGSALVGTRLQTGGALLAVVDRDTEVARTARELERGFGGLRSFEMQLRAEPGHFHKAEGIMQLEELTAELREQDAVLGVRTPTTRMRDAWAMITDDPSARAEALDSPQRITALQDLLEASGAPPEGISADASRAQLQARVADRPAPELASLVQQARDAMDEAGVRGTVTGEAVALSESLERLSRSLAGGLALAVVVIFGVVSFLLRSLRLGLLALPTNALPLAVMAAYMALRGIPFDASTGIAFTIVLGLVVDGTIHVLVRFREERGRARGVTRSILSAARGSGRAVVVASATLLAGFSALLLSDFVPVRHFAELALVGIGSGLFADLIVLPALVGLSHTALERSSRVRRPADGVAAQRGRAATGARPRGRPAGS